MDSTHAETTDARPAHTCTPPARGQTAKLRLLFWETTAGCNLECVHCRRSEASKTTAQEDLTTLEARALLDEIARFARPILVLSGGEPLLRTDIFDLAEHARRNGLTVALATNGTLIDSEMAGRIVTAGIQRVAISIDGADANTHDDFRRQPGSLERALAGFRLLKSRGMSMQINCTITRHNVHQVADIYALAAKLDADALHYFMLVPVGCGMQIAETNALTANVYEQVLEQVYRLGQKGPLHVRATCAPHYFRILRQIAATEGRHPRVEGQAAGGHAMSAMTKGCLAGSAVCFVSHTGEVFPCGYLPVSAGNVKHRSLGEIWHSSSLFAQLRNPDLLEGKCGICEFKRVCSGCRARAYYEYRNYLAEEPYCVYQPQGCRASAGAHSRSPRPANHQD